MKASEKKRRKQLAIEHHEAKNLMISIPALKMRKKLEVESQNRIKFKMERNHEN